MSSFVRMRLYNLPDSRATKRLQSNSVWLESARVSKSLVSLRFCCSWSPIFADISLDVESGFVFSASIHLASLCDRINSSAKGILEGTARITSIAREVEASSNDIWPHQGKDAWSPSHRPIIERHALDAIRAFTSSLSSSFSINVKDQFSDLENVNEISSSVSTNRQLNEQLNAVLDGLALSISLIVTAFHHSRRTVVAKPLPFWLTTMSSSFISSSSYSRSTNSSSDEFDGGDAPHSQVFDFDADVLEHAISGLCSLQSLFRIDKDLNKIEYNNENLMRLSLDSILFLYWLLCLAPTHLVRLQKPTAEGAIASYSVLHGCRDLHVPFHEDDIILWDEAAYKAYGRYRIAVSNFQPSLVSSVNTNSNTRILQSPRWYHGTASTNAHCILSFGLRTLSGTRHESTGGMYGEGVYLSNSLSVARNFSKAVGFDWSGFSLSLGGIAARHISTSDKTSIKLKDKIVTSTLQIVFEVDLIAAPGNKIMVEGRDIREEAEQRGIAQNAGYVVVPDASHLWISTLHAFSDETKTTIGETQLEGENRKGNEGPGYTSNILLFLVLIVIVFWYMFNSLS
jgi:hypothetical protein